MMRKFEEQRGPVVFPLLYGPQVASPECLLCQNQRQAPGFEISNFWIFPETQSCSQHEKIIHIKGGVMVSALPPPPILHIKIVCTFSIVYRYPVNVYFFQFYRE